VSCSCKAKKTAVRRQGRGMAEERQGKEEGIEKKIAYFLKLCELLTLLNN
jgi:hypothetical protein